MIALGLTYGSPEALEFTEELFVSMAQASLLSNITRGKVKGCYPEFKPDAVVKSRYFKFLAKFTKIPKNYSLRNCTMLSIAPTGSIATMLGGSGGIEPEFQFEYIRKTDNLKDSYKIESKIVRDFRKIHPTLPLPNYFVSSDDISWKDRINTQAVIQKYIDTAISSTINLPSTVSRAEIEQLYLYAWKRKLKGVTIYRKGCKRNGILVGDDSSKKSSKEKQKLQRGYVIPPNDNVIGFKKTLKTGCGTLHCEVFFDADTNNLVEVYLNKGSAGGCNNFMVGLSRMISVSARGGIPVADIVDQLTSAGTCPSYYARKKSKKDTSRGSSCPVAVGYAIKELWEDFQGKELILKDKEELLKTQNENKVESEPKCPQCGNQLIFEGGCNTCKSCGWSKCE